MDDGRFDALVRSLATGSSRRQVLRRILGLGGAVVASSTVLEADAARRPTPAPVVPKCPGRQTWKNGACTCPDDAPVKCGPDCCTHSGTGPVEPGQSVCCDGACCFGECYGEEMCCPYGQEYCAVAGECCPAGWTCCNDTYFGVGCIPPGKCCAETDCVSPDPCEVSYCVPGNECFTAFDCGFHPETCCTGGLQCRVGGDSCCNPSCEFLPPCQFNECGEQCPCLNPNEVCNGLVCYPSCSEHESPCGDCGDCGCLYDYVGGGPTTCLNTGTIAGHCNTYSDCPIGSVCSELASSEPGYAYLCLYPCCVDN